MNGFGKVILACGGGSSEAEISRRGARDIFASLSDAGVDVEMIDGIPSLIDRVSKGDVSAVFNLIHGKGGEDGVLQGLMASFSIPVTGCGILASALSMDKERSKLVWKGLGLPVADWVMVKPKQDIEDIEASLGYPCVLKPSREGSSVGVRIVKTRSELQAALQEAEMDGQFMAEQFIEGDEFTVGIVAERVLPGIRIEPGADFYDYTAKYESNSTKYYCPCGLDAGTEAQLGELAYEAFRALDGRGWGRVDLIRDKDGKFILLEVNTTPGMTNTSLVPKAAAASGMGFQDLVLEILRTAEVPG